MDCNPRLLRWRVAALTFIGVALPMLAAAQSPPQPELPGCPNYCDAVSCGPGQIRVCSFPNNPQNSRLSPYCICTWGLCDICPGALAGDALAHEALIAVAAGSVTALANLLRFNAQVTPNVERQAVQVSGCSDDALVASIPLPPAEFSSLSQELRVREALTPLFALALGL